jgi:hypothetical protein
MNEDIGREGGKDLKRKKSIGMGRRGRGWRRKKRRV